MTNERPLVASKMPSVMELEPGEYWWCSCGKSSSQPFCDGSHKGTSFVPQKVEVTKKKKVALCNCKHSKKGSHCDGTHASIS